MMLDALFLMFLIWCADSDQRRRTIPNQAMVGLCALGLVQIGYALGLGAPVWVHLAAIPLLGILYLCWTRDLLGGGDVKLMALICLYLGLGHALIAFEICLAVLCAIYFLTAKGRKRPRHRKAALAPPLAWGCAGVIAGQYILAWL